MENDNSELNKSIIMQWDAIAKLTGAKHTAETNALYNSLLSNDYIYGVQTFASALNKNIIEAPNIAFLKNVKSFTDTISSSLPKGLAGLLKDLHSKTAKRLANSEDISYNLAKKSFFSEASPENVASVTEMNIICSSLEVLGELEEASLIEFMNYISKYPEFAGQHKTGIKINEVISNWLDRIDFDYELYYHGRAYENGQCPYTEQQMTKAPSGVTGHGRYSHIGESHFYFSNKLQGAVNEVRKHSNKDMKMQIAKIQPKRKIAMIDLSAEIKTQNKFLEYCRFSPDEKEFINAKREYLIPCFVASCCKMNGIEGIKYYGSKEYFNYVSWSDDYFDFMGFELE